MKYLVIGSVHLDIYAEYNEETKDNIDKLGALHYSIGGGAFNVAANLAFNRVDHIRQVSLFTYIKPDSMSADVIKAELANRYIRSCYVFEWGGMDESGYVAQLLRGTLKSAVSCIGIEKVPLIDKEIDRLKTAIREHDVIITDTNISINHLKEVAKWARVYGKLLFTSCVSESQLNRLAGIKTTNEHCCKIVFICENEEGNDSPAAPGDPELVRQRCQSFGCSYLVVTHDTRYSVYDSDNGEIATFRYQMPQGQGSGRWARDALVAAVCSYYAENRNTDWEMCNQNVISYTQPVLNQNRAIPLVEKPITTEQVRIRHRKNWACFFAGLLIMITIIGATWAICHAGGYDAVKISLFFLIPTLAGAAGGVARIVWKLTVNNITHWDEAQDTIGSSVVLGMLAGLVTSLLSIYPMSSGGASAFNLNTSIFIYEFCVGLAAGFTLDVVLKKLTTTDATKMAP